MKNELQIFNNSEFGEIRTFKEPDGSVTFCGADVAKSLGYKDTVNALKLHCKEDGVAFHHIIDNLGRTQQAKFITKGNLCRLAASSQLPGAEKFESWIFDIVIPTVLEHGVYATADTAEKLLNDPDFLIQTFTSLKEEREKRKALELETAQQKQIIGELQPKANYVDTILKNPGLVTITQISKDYGMTGCEMNKLLHTHGVQYNQSGQWLLYAKYQACGYTHSDTVAIKHKDGTPDVTMNTKWTQKGRLFIYQLLKDNGILPTIEKMDKISA